VRPRPAEHGRGLLYLPARGYIRERRYYGCNNTQETFTSRGISEAFLLIGRAAAALIINVRTSLHPENRSVTVLTPYLTELSALWSAHF